MRSVRWANSLRVHSGGVRAAPGGSGNREVVGLSLMAEAVDGADVGCLSFACLIKVAAAGCGLVPLVGEGQSIEDGCFSWKSVMGGPIG